MTVEVYGAQGSPHSKEASTQVHRWIPTRLPFHGGPKHMKTGPAQTSPGTLHARPGAPKQGPASVMRASIVLESIALESRASEPIAVESMAPASTHATVRSRVVASSGATSVT